MRLSELDIGIGRLGEVVLLMVHPNGRDRSIAQAGARCGRDGVYVQRFPGDILNPGSIDAREALHGRLFGAWRVGHWRWGGTQCGHGLAAQSAVSCWELNKVGRLARPPETVQGWIQCQITAEK